MSIVTKFGDNGRTSLIGGEIVDKNDERIEALGCVDELNSFIGFVISFSEEDFFNEDLKQIQKDLHLISANIALSKKAPEQIQNKIKIFNSERIERIEELIVALEKNLPPQNSFILYGGSKISSLFFLLMTITRRVERRVVQIKDKININPNILKYLNRLSDLFFLMGRFINFKKGIVEEKL